MAVERFIKNAHETPESTEASEVIKEGDLVTLEDGGGAHRTDPASDAVVDAIVPHREMGQHLPEHEYDYGPVQYEAGTFPVPIYGVEDPQYLVPNTVRDDAAPAPSVGLNDVVGVIMMDGSSYGSGRPVVVQEGYTASPDGTEVTFSRSNDNFLALGVAKNIVDAHDEQVKVEPRARLQASR